MRASLVGLALAALLIPAPTAADSSSWETELVASLGCTATVRKFPAWFGINAYYSPWTHSIGLIGLDALPLDWQRLIVAHETAHCLQAQQGEFDTLRARGPHEIEWDADSFAFKVLADRYGVDGAEVSHDIWAWAYHASGFTGDDNSPHGLFTHRITRGYLNQASYYHQGA